MSRQVKRQQRECEIIKATLDLLHEQGFLDLKMAEVAKASGCSMGVVYSHFASKEDLLLGCANVMTKHKHDYLKKVPSYDLSVELSIVIMPIMIWEHFTQYPGQYEIMPMACLPSVWQRASTMRVEELSRVGAETQELTRPKVEELLTKYGIDTVHSTQFLCGLMGMAIGIFDIQNSGFGLIDSNADHFSEHHPLLENIRRFMAGWGIDLAMTTQDWQLLQRISNEIIASSSCFGER
uniref:TetR/AcrR family transcriptional regulator n=1 Tax=Thaumasiovibrio occultus TaxID=1891184 RepID=UPI00131C47B9|nr:TetR/AcrR family transcriptional regulator [Thaumasiovibrio occultus]